MAEEAFKIKFGREPEITTLAEGRVNLMGEHTDYNDGFVLPTTIPQFTTAMLARRDDNCVHALSDNVDTGALVYQLGRETPGRGWLDYVQGVTRVLTDRVGPLASGFDLFLSSNVPLGAGLSSSAALEVALLRGLRALFELALDDVGIAVLGQQAENRFVGAPVGIMDQMAVSLGHPGTALFLDTRSLEFRAVSLPASVELVVIDSGVAHNHAAGDYRVRRAECEEAARLLGVSTLRDLAEDQLPRAMVLREPLGRRVRHVLSENRRVLDLVTALEANDTPSIGRLFSASHASMRDDYEVSVPEVDRLVTLADGNSDIVGARLTGGGFGGAVVLFALRNHGREAGERIAAIAGGTARVLVPDR